MHRLAFLLTFLFAALSSTHAQWDIEASHTTADLRGIHNVGKGIAWASGTEGTVLRTTSDGKDWPRCAPPPTADHLARPRPPPPTPTLLDLRGNRASAASPAIVMSSDKGPPPRLYKTTDA